MKTTDQILQDLERKLANIEVDAQLENVGTVDEIGDGVVIVSGLSNVAMGEIVEFEDGSLGFTFNLDEDTVSIILLGRQTAVTSGSKVKKTGKFLAVGVSEGFLGRVVNALGEPLDGMAKPPVKKVMPLERIAAGVIERKSV